MKTTRRLVALILSVLMMLSVCSFASADEQEPITLRFWAHWGSEQRRPTINKICDMFNEKYADQGIQVEYVYVPYGDIETKMLASVTAGNPPAVVITAIEDVATKAMRNQAANIKEYLAEDTQSKFYDKYWDMVTWNDGVYAIPFNTDTRLLFYNKAMFETAGVSVDEIVDWESFKDACVKLDEALTGTGDYIAAFYPTLGNFGFDTIAMANGSNGIYDSNTNPNEVVLDRKENVEALEFMMWFAQRYGQDTLNALDAANAGGSQDLFLSGKIAMFGQTCNYLATIDMYNAEAKIDYGCFALPAGPSAPGGETGAWGGGFVCTVPYGTEHPAEATLLAEFLATEGAAVWGAEQLDVMCAIEANENPVMSSYKGWDTVLDLMQYTKGTRRHIYGNAANGYKDDAVNKIMKTFESTDCQGVLTEAAQKIKNAIEEEAFIFGE